MGIEALERPGVKKTLRRKHPFWATVPVLLGVFGILAASQSLYSSGLPPSEQPSVIVVVGAGGEEEYATQFVAWAGAWETNAQMAGRTLKTIGLKPPKQSNDLEEIKDLLMKVDKTASQELWFILLGHGTFDGKEAKFNLRGPDLSAKQLAGWFEGYTRPLLVINTSSSSAPFLAALSRSNRVVITATRSGNEMNYSRFGNFLSKSIAAIEADLDKDGQTSLLEAFLHSSRQVIEFYKTEGRLATEHALLEDNGDHLGTPADWFSGIRAVKKPLQAASRRPGDPEPHQGSADGLRAHQFHLQPGKSEAALSPASKAKRDALEVEIANWRDQKSKLTESEYYSRLEGLMLQLGQIYRSAAER